MPTNKQQVTINLYCGLANEGRKEKDLIRKLIDKAGQKYALNNPAEIIKKSLMEAVK